MALDSRDLKYICFECQTQLGVARLNCQTYIEIHDREVASCASYKMCIVAIMMGTRKHGGDQSHRWYIFIATLLHLSKKGYSNKNKTFKDAYDINATPTVISGYH